MEFENGQSIYNQIADNLSDKIINEEYQPGEKIPSVRELTLNCSLKVLSKIKGE